jgi:hypothetical protein
VTRLARFRAPEFRLIDRLGNVLAPSIVWLRQNGRWQLVAEQQTPISWTPPWRRRQLLGDFNHQGPAAR